MRLDYQLLLKSIVMIYDFLLTVLLEPQYRHFRLCANLSTIFHFFLVTVGERSSQVN